MFRKILPLLLPTLILAGSCSTDIKTAGNRSAVTVDDYRRAETMLSQSTSKLVYNATVRPSWIDDSHFWYQSSDREGNIFLLVNAATGEKKPAFDHKEVARALSKLTGEKYLQYDLPFRSVIFSDDMSSMEFVSGGKRYRCNTDGSSLQVDEIKMPDSRSVLSPDGRLAAFIREHNLWLFDTSTGEETQLTIDGEADYGYATNNAGWTKSDGPVLLWSPDSRKIATFRHDGRGTGSMYLATTNVGHPELEAWKYPLPGDSAIFMIERIVIDVQSKDITRLMMEPDAHRSTITDHIAGRDGQFLDVEWSDDATMLSFVSTSRDHRHEILRVADPVTGEVRKVLEEHEETFYESGYNSINWRVLESSGEVIWYSQADDWGHLYLHDLKSGELKNRITTGSWKVLSLLKVDEESRKIWFTAAGKEPGDPYFQYLYSVQLDGSGLSLLTPDSANHEISLSPGGDYIVDYASTPAEPPVTNLRYTDGSDPLLLEEADITDLLNAGWVPPVPFTVKARDGRTDLYGLMHKPSNFDPAKRYPIINYIYPGPQSGSVGSRSFTPSRGDRQAIAELGFIVVAIDAMGTPMRSKSFHEAYYGNMGDNGLPDQVSGMKQLAKKYEWIDIDRAGIYGHSGGGFASTAAILSYPEFFKVAVSSAGNHDNRNYEDDWGEKWQGLLEVLPDGTDNYFNQANQLKADRLEGKLLLAHGTMDSNVPPYNTLLVVDKLIEANRDFDLLLFPNRGHGFGNEPYMMRRRWDYFVKHLQGAEPPVEYQIGKER